MNDRFKFRYFNKYANKMVEPENWQNVDAIYECIKQQVCFDEDIAPLPYDHIGNGLVFMQCTGLKDKNSKLIYEGDIVRFKDCNDILVINYQKKLACFAPQFYCDGKYGGRLWFDDYDSSECQFYKSNNFEVIGNIYENKELLESEG